MPKNYKIAENYDIKNEISSTETRKIILKCMKKGKDITKN